MPPEEPPAWEYFPDTPANRVFAAINDFGSNSNLEELSSRRHLYQFIDAVFHQIGGSFGSSRSIPFSDIDSLVAIDQLVRERIEQCVHALGADPENAIRIVKARAEEWCTLLESTLGNDSRLTQSISNVAATSENWPVMAGCRDQDLKELKSRLTKIGVGKKTAYRPGSKAQLTYFASRAKELMAIIEKLRQVERTQWEFARTAQKTVEQIEITPSQLREQYQGVIFRGKTPDESQYLQRYIDFVEAHPDLHRLHPPCSANKNSWWKEIGKDLLQYQWNRDQKLYAADTGHFHPGGQKPVSEAAIQRFRQEFYKLCT